MINTLKYGEKLIHLSFSLCNPFSRFAIWICFGLMSSMLLISCSHTASLGKAPAKTKLVRIGLSKDNAKFVCVETGAPFVIWGVNYDHDGAGRLLEDYWCDEWPTAYEYAEDRTIAGAITKEWLEHFRAKSPEILGTNHEIPTSKTSTRTD